MIQHPQAVCVALLLLTLTPRPATAATISDTGQGFVDVPSTNEAELSGLTRATGDAYYAVPDEDAELYSLQIQVDPTSGRIVSVDTGARLDLAVGHDLEEVVYTPAGTVLVADETGPTIREFDITTGSVIGFVVIPPPYALMRSNRGLESLALDQDGGLWTANEAALTVDGPLADTETGSVVRIQHFDANRQPGAQWAYVTEPAPTDAGLLNQVLTSGVVDIAVLPSGEVLVMERHIGLAIVVPFTLIYIFQIDIDDATDVSSFDSLDGADFVPATKTLLYADDVGVLNFESMALGPELEGGDLSLLLLSEGSGFFGNEPQLKALRVTPVPEPAGAAQALMGLALLAVKTWSSHRRH